MYDRSCSDCGAVREDLLEPIGKFNPIPCECGGFLRRTIATGKFHRSTAVSPDGIPGGVQIKHGLCWPDGTPRRFDSHSEMKRAAQDLGVTNMVRHVPLEGTDKSPHTTRWVSAPVQSEEERVRYWHEHERLMGYAPMNPRASASGVQVVGEGPDRLSDIIADSIQKAESSGFHEAAYRGVNNPYRK
jgi:hypothetical protein